MKSESEDVKIEMRGNVPPANNVNDAVVQEWEGCIRGNKITQRSERRRQIGKILPLLLTGEKGLRNHDYYEPAVVSLGPYHHNRHDLSAAENYKLITVEEYRLSCGSSSMVSLYNKVFEVVHDARKFYIDGLFLRIIFLYFLNYFHDILYILSIHFIYFIILFVWDHFTRLSLICADLYKRVTTFSSTGRSHMEEL
ncbi:hypothetical protein LXL04_001667 [Taraxacum kok-saghyz]